MCVRYTEGEINFNLMALVSDRRAVLTRQIHDLAGSGALLGMPPDALAEELSRLQALMDYEELKMHRYEIELARRRHNYLPFIMELLKILAEEKKLSQLLIAAREKVKKRLHKRMKT